MTTRITSVIVSSNGGAQLIGVDKAEYDKVSLKSCGVTVEKRFKFMQVNELCGVRW